jgi:hypothetical protein
MKANLLIVVYLIASSTCLRIEKNTHMFSNTLRKQAQIFEHKNS